MKQRNREPGRHAAESAVKTERTAKPLLALNVGSGSIKVGSFALPAGTAGKRQVRTPGRFPTCLGFVRAGTLSALLVRYRVQPLDLIGVLTARE